MAKTTFMRGALILSVAGILSKIIGAFFRIPLGNWLGSDGLAYYHSVYPIYVLLLTLSIAGFPVAVSRMVSERIVKEDYYGAHRVFRYALLIMSIIGLALFLALWFTSDAITNTERFEKVKDAYYAMRAIAPALFFVSINSVFKGYFQGMRNMTPSAIHQVVEQIFRVAIGLSLAYYLLPKGEPYAAAGATFGATAGAIAAFFVIYIIYLVKIQNKEYRGKIKESRLANYETRTPFRSILYSFFAIAIPVTIGSAIMPIMNNIDLFIVMKRLSESGFGEEEVRTLYGQLSGMAGSIINLPQVVTLSIAVSMVPTIVAAIKTKDKEFLHRNVLIGVRMTVIIAMPCTIGLMALAGPILHLLYPLQPEDATGSTPVLTILAIGIVFLTINQTLTGILQGAGRQARPMINLAIGACFKVVITFILTGIPAINILGAATGTVVAYFIATILNFRSTTKYTGVKFDWKLIIGRPLLASLTMGVVALVAYKLLVALIGNSLSTVIAILLAGMVYIVMIFVTNSITREELSVVPKGNIIIKVYDKVKNILNRGKN